MLELFGWDITLKGILVEMCCVYLGMYGVYEFTGLLLPQNFYTRRIYLFLISELLDRRGKKCFCLYGLAHLDMSYETVIKGDFNV